MKKDWLEDIHDRMADFEVDAPQGLWDDLCAAEAKMAEAPVGNHEGKPVIGPHKREHGIWMGSTAAAAACLLLFWFLRPEKEQVTELPSVSSQATASTDHRTSMEEQVLPEKSVQAEPQIITAMASAPKSVKSVHEVEAADVAKTLEEAKPLEEEKPLDEAPPQEEGKSSAGKRPSENKQNEPLKRHEYLAQATPRRHSSDPRLTVGLMTSGGLDSDNRQLFQSGSVVASTMVNETDWMDSPLLGIMALNRGAETERKVTHHAPIRTGLSFAYHLNDRWSIESGITYALVTSAIHEGSASNFIEQEQKLHYAGIPLGITCRLFSWKRLDLYLSSNILAEQCVSGQLRKKYIIGEKAQGEEEVSALHSRPMQWSVGAKAGLQYNLTSIFSIYAEPGCSYYLDDHSSLETVFKDKAFDFNLNVGLRFSVGQ